MVEDDEVRMCDWDGSDCEVECVREREGVECGCGGD